MNFQQLQQRIRDRRAALARELLDERRARAAAATDSTAPLSVGARVFDRVSGQEGEVIGGARENIIVPTPDKQNG